MWKGTIAPALVDHTIAAAIAPLTHYDRGWIVLGGALAVPYNPQSALAGLNSLPEGTRPEVSALLLAVMVRSHHDEGP